MMQREPSTVDWMLPPEQEPGEVERRWNVAPDRPVSVPEAYAMGGLAGLDRYDDPASYVHPDFPWTEYDKAQRDEAKLAPQRAAIAQQYRTTAERFGMPHDPGAAGRIHGMQTLAQDMLIPSSALDVALYGSPVKAGRAIMGGLGALDSDEAQAKGGKAAKAIGSILNAAPVAEAATARAIKAAQQSQPARTMFDYSKIHDVPDVKQFDLPRYDPKRGVSERVQSLIANKDVERQMHDYIQKGKDINAQTFYYNEPLRQAFVSELGKDKGQKGFERYMDYVAGSSPRSDVETNARNASYYYWLEKQGMPVPPQGGKNPQPYGHMAQNLHRENAEKIRSGEYFDVINNPKPLSFSQNLQGNFAPVTVDAHAFKLPAMLARDPKFIAGSIKLEKGQPTINPSKMLASGEISMDDAFKRPVFWAARPNPNEYGAMEQYYKRLAAEAGMTPGQTQAAAWAGGGPITGLESVAGDPFMRSVENRAIKTAAERGISPEEALSRMMRGKAPLLGLGGAGMLGGVAAQDQYD
jgi:hypothetical protein